MEQIARISFTVILGLGLCAFLSSSRTFSTPLVVNGSFEKDEDIYFWAKRNFKVSPITRLLFETSNKTQVIMLYR